MDEGLIPYDLGPGERAPGVPFRNVFPRNHQIEVFDMVLPKHLEGPLLAPFRAGGLTIEGSFDVELYPGAAERLDEMTRNHPDYCNVCENFPCLGGHPPEG